MFDVLAKNLKEKGYEVLTFATGKQAAEKTASVTVPSGTVPRQTSEIRPAARTESPWRTDSCFAVQRRW